MIQGQASVFRSREAFISRADNHRPARRVAGTGAGGDEKGVLRLTVKEKALLLLGEHLLDGRDVAEYPLDMTQKGIADNFAIRRSHVAASLRGLIEDGLVEQTKGRVEGEQRRQNIYRLTPKGLAKAKEVKDRLMRLEVEFEKDSETQKLKVADLLAASRLEIPSIVNQLEKGRVVRPEINLVMKPEKRLVTVYCPTCERSMEVENIYGDEEVGFDCPVCGRPYRITPGERPLPQPGAKGERVGSASSLPTMVVLLIIGLLLAELFLFFPWVLMNPMFVIAVVAVVTAVLAWRTRRPARSLGTAQSKRMLSASILASVTLLGVALVTLWNMLVIEVDFVSELMTAGPIALAFAAGYFGLARTRASLAGEFLLAGGALIILVMMLIPFVETREGFGIATAPFLAIIGVAAVLLSTLHHVERELQLLDLVMAAGGLVLAISFLGLSGGDGSLLAIILMSSLALLGTLMVLMRIIQPRYAPDLSGHFMAAVPLSLGLLFVTLGVLMILGGAEVAGVIEIVLVAPFVHYGLSKVFTEDWMYRLPFAAFFTFIELIAIAHTLLV